MTTLGKVIFVKAKEGDHGKWLLLNFHGFLLAQVALEESTFQGAISALEKMKVECESRFPGSRLYSKSATEYLVLS
jgi:hypothetical protein